MRPGGTNWRIKPGAGSTTRRKPKAFERAQRHQHAHVLRHAAQRAGRGQQQQAEHQAAFQAQAIGQRAEGHARRHARQLHQRQQETGLQQRHAQRLLQRGDGRRQLADMQRRTDAGEHHDHRRTQRRIQAPVQRTTPASPKPHRAAAANLASPVRWRRPLAG
jgi:hypothetical protein